MPTKAFLKARKQGEVAQSFVAGMFRSWGLEVRETPRGYHPGYDLYVTGILHGTEIRNAIEVKYDKKSAETNNIYLDINSLRKSRASILTICLNEPIDTVLMLPLQDALNYALARPNVIGGEYQERSCLVNKDEFISALKPKVLMTTQSEQIQNR
jgi:hypothetical protein